MTDRLDELSDGLRSRVAVAGRAVPRDRLINCDAFLKFVQAEILAGRGLNTSTFFGRVARLGRQPSYAYSSFGYTRHIDGISSVSYLEYHQSDTVRYTKRAIVVP